MRFSAPQRLAQLWGIPRSTYPRLSLVRRCHSLWRILNCILMRELAIELRGWTHRGGPSRKIEAATCHYRLRRFRDICENRGRFSGTATAWHGVERAKDWVAGLATGFRGFGRDGGHGAVRPAARQYNGFRGLGNVGPGGCLAGSAAVSAAAECAVVAVASE